MKTMWKGAISFGLVSIPVRVYPATEEKTLRFNQLHEEDNGRIRYKRTCQKCGKEVEFSEIVKGYEYDKDHYVVMTDEDFDAVPLESSRTIDIERFVDLDSIDPIYYQKSYYLAPEETGVKAYHLLTQALEQGGKVGVAKVSFRGKEHLASIRLRGGALVLETMYWPDEIREPAFDELKKTVKVKPQEVKMAESLIQNLSEAWDPAAFTDEYREALVKIVDKKVAGEEIEVIETEEAPKVVDLMDALKQSVEQTKKLARKKPAKKTAARAPRKKAAAG
ncbi:MAG: Ku protein [Actinomycetota bacterium]